MQAILLFFCNFLKSGSGHFAELDGELRLQGFSRAVSLPGTLTKSSPVCLFLISPCRAVAWNTAKPSSLNHPPGTCWETGSGFPPQQQTQCHRDHYSSLCFYFGHGNNKENTRMMFKVHPLELKEPLGTGPPSVADTECGLFAPPLETGPQLATAPNSLLQIPPASNHHQVDAGVRRLKVTAARAC